MAWRNQGITGSNNIPLGRRRFAGEEEDESRTASPSSVPDGPKRGRSPARAEPAADGVKRRKKRNRWGDQQENKAAGLMGLPTMIMANFTSEQLEAYTLHLRIEEISQKLRINDVVPGDGDRSPSPPPQYDNFGRRVNTREYRYRKRLEDERHKLIEKAMKTIPNYHPPSDYRRPTKTQEKVYVPVNDYPEINFIGLLIGPRGNTLKKMETESGAKIAIRGKGSVKEGKGRSDAAHASNQEEDLHCLIMADTEEKVNKAKKLVHNVIETAASIPEGQNELKRNQLRELAALNGTLRDDENQACQNCGQIGHRKYDCPEQRNFTANIICRVCGNAGHMARDCPDRQRGSDWRNGGNGGGIGGAPRNPRAIGTGDAVDREMEQLMNELSGGAPGEYPPRRIEAGPDQGGYPAEDRDAKPWQRGPPASDVAPWQQRREQRPRDDYSSRDQGGPAPWAAQNRGGNDYGGYGSHGGYAAPGTATGAAPWQQQAPPGGAPPAAAPAAPGYGYGAYTGYAYPPGMAAPGMAAPPPPPGMPSMGGYGGAGSPPPPPPPGDGPPPPPPSDQPPPPPPPA
ncbi:Branchpoint-bridging protein [Penicillium subrubescens]|uniref:Branchpoint-bridging protein n=1 Tax=Penicillium subrubescens TaxID=1316194 RepID=A0A1Q5UN19_9EURO|nr:Branchpoint-bridging protein [Penicillium subrubescens]KAJ5891052.1 Branchpoint-bridging protein [Penicillium subrubescens]OKP13839.1 Branchpoint-bridging protein [Penicillium subrubescens]